MFGRRDYRDSLISVGSLPICYGLILSDLILFSKLLQGFYEFDISDYATMAYARPGLRSDSRLVFQLHPFKKFYSRTSYSYRTVNNAKFILCNSDMKFLGNISSLKSELKNFLLRRVSTVFLIVNILVHSS